MCIDCIGVHGYAIMSMMKRGLYMYGKNKFITVCFFILVLFSVFTLVSSVSAASSKTIDTGSSMTDSNTDISWNAKMDSNKNIVVNEKTVNTKRNVNTTKKVEIEYYKKNRLKLFVSGSKSYVKPGEGLIGDMSVSKPKIVKSKYSPYNYYFKVYKPKILNKIPKKTTFDSWNAPIQSNLKTSLKIKGIIYQSGSIIFYKNYKGNSSKSDLKILIQKSSNSRLKITQTTISKINKTKIFTVKSKLTPKNYYLKNYRAKLSKYVVKSKLIDKRSTKDRSWNTYYYYFDNKIRVIFNDINPGDCGEETIQKYSSSKFIITSEIGSIFWGTFYRFPNSNLNLNRYYFDVYRKSLL